MVTAKSALTSNHLAREVTSTPTKEVRIFSIASNATPVITVLERPVLLLMEGARLVTSARQAHLLMISTPSSLVTSLEATLLWLLMHLILQLTQFT